VKRPVFILFLLTFAISLNAQVTQEVIASSGGYNVNGNVSLSWTLGETIVPTLKSPDGALVLSHGFQQKLLVTAVEETIYDLVKIKVFPNPVTEAVNIQFDAPLEEEISLDILDSQGKLIKTDIIEPASTVKEINMQDVAGGIYYIRLSSDKHINVYKVVKL
jgi:hypothetical protein